MEITMTFYHELQLNQAGSKTVIRNAADRREKLRHIAIYLFKIAITMLFCMGFVMGASSLLGEENSIVGVVVLLFLMVFKNADFGICMKHSLFVIAVIFAVLARGHTRLSAASPVIFVLRGNHRRDRRRIIGELRLAVLFQFVRRDGCRNGTDRASGRYFLPDFT